MEILLLIGIVFGGVGLIIATIWLASRLYQIGENQRDIQGILKHLKLRSGSAANLMYPDEK